MLLRIDLATEIGARWDTL